MKKVLVAGATGYLGKYVVKELKTKGYWVRALGRNQQKLDSINSDIDEKFIAEITDKNMLTGICKNMDVVFSSIGITKQKDGLTYMAVDYQANKNLLDEAIISGVKKFIYVSVFGIEKMKNLKAIKAKLKFENALKDSGLDYTIIYPNGFFSDMKEYLQMAKKGKGMVVGSGNNKINPIHGADLAEVCVDAVNSHESVIEVGGPDIFTHNEIFKIAFDTYHAKLKVSHFPIWMKSLSLALLRILTPVKVYGPVEFFMTVLSTNMVAPKYGKIKLEDYFYQQVEDENLIEEIDNYN
jgi:uncharacterized protein YbjT (DUF2867 family)